MDRIRQDVRFAFRTLRRSRGFAVVASLAIAIAIGVNTAIFSVIDAVLLKPLPYANADGIAALWNSYGDQGPNRAPLSPAEFADLREQARSFSEIAGFADRSIDFTGRDEPVRLQGLAVSPNFFQALGATRRSSTPASPRTSPFAPAATRWRSRRRSAPWCEGSIPSSRWPRCARWKTSWPPPPRASASSSCCSRSSPGRRCCWRRSGSTA